jgi:hypothetical protein
MRVARRDARGELAEERAAGHWVDPDEGETTAIAVSPDTDDHAVDHR